MAAVLNTTGRLQPLDTDERVTDGERHEVTVLEHGFVYRDERYKSLSAVARTISGSRWNGYDFFALQNGGGA